MLLFNSQLTVALTPDLVTVSSDRRTDHYPFSVWWDAAESKVTGVAEAAIPGSQRVSLAHVSADLPPAMDKHPLLATYFRVVLGEAVREAFFRVKPKVTVTGVDLLAGPLAGYHRGLIRSALLEGGAMTVEFA